MLYLARPFASTAQITQSFGPTANTFEPPYEGWPHFHRGVDYALEGGTPQLASAAGRVLYAGWDTSGYGWTVLVDVGWGISVRVAHLAELAVHTGQPVAKGAQLGLTGSSGNSTGAHCHWEVCSYGAPVHPYVLLDPHAVPVAG